jgi:hypothetical protein
MKLKKAILGGSILWMMWSVQASDIDESIRILTKVYEIPPWQSIIASMTRQKDGSVVGAVVGGDVNSSFPGGMVLLEACLPIDLPDDAVKETIRSMIRWTCGQAFPSGIAINSIGQHEFVLDSAVTTSNEEPKELQVELKNSAYRLTLIPKSFSNNDLTARIRFEAKKSFINELETLMVQTLDLSYTKNLLIGFPRSQTGDRGTVYWLAFSVQRFHSEPIKRESVRRRN